jgi:magnesium chelatase accessory protein
MSATDWTPAGSDWPHHRASRFIDAGGLRWHVQSWGGDGEPGLLLLHGTGASTHSFRMLGPRLAASRGALAVDLPGHGFSGPMPRGQATMAGMAQALGQLLQALKLAPEVVLGHSAGAAVMLRMALDGHLARARTLIGLNAALLPFEGLAGLLYPPMARLLALNPLVPHLAAWRAQDARSVRRLIESTGSRLDDEGLALYARLLRRPAHVAGALAMMADWDLDALSRDLPRLQAGMPTPAAPRLHLFVGEADAAVPKGQAERVAGRMPGAVALHRLPGLGHLAHEEAPQVVARALAPLVAAPAHTA